MKTTFICTSIWLKIQIQKCLPKLSLIISEIFITFVTITWCYTVPCCTVRARRREINTHINTHSLYPHRRAQKLARLTTDRYVIYGALIYTYACIYLRMLLFVVLSFRFVSRNILLESKFLIWNSSVSGPKDKKIHSLDFFL